MIDLKELLKAGVHFGHNTSRWSPKMRPFIWGARNKIHLIDVSKTAILLERAGTFLKETAAQGKSVLWVGTKKAAQEPILKAAALTQQPSVVHRWIGGTLSNHDQVKKAITRLLHLKDVVKKSLNHYGKKEQSMITKEVLRLEKNVGGIIDYDYPPGVIVVVDAKKERSAVKEALKLGVPVVAIIDTNTDPTGIPFIIPANDDSPRSIVFLLNYLANCVQDGLKLHAEAQQTAAAEKAASRKAVSAASATPGKKEAAKKAPSRNAKGGDVTQASAAEKPAQPEPAEPLSYEVGNDEDEDDE